MKEEVKLATSVCLLHQTLLFENFWVRLC